MLTVHSISKSFGDQTILKDISFTLNSGERLGLVGPNGCGKTTLLRILAGEQTPDRGSFQLDPPDLRIGYLPQGFSLASAVSAHAFLDQMAGDLVALSARLEAAAAQLAVEPDQPALQQAYDEALSAIQAASLSESQRPAILAAFDLANIPPETPLAHLSGGQKTRLALAGVLLASPQLLLLDEPTNHLDIEILEWLEDWLASSPLIRHSAVLIVSHDRLFLDRTVTRILELDAATRQARLYVGNYSAYLEQKQAERDRHWQAYSDQQEEIARLRRAVQTVRGKVAFKRGGKGDSGDKFAKGFFADRTKEHLRRAKHLEHRLEKLLTADHIEKPRQSWQVKADFDGVVESSRQALAAEDLAAGYDGVPLLEGLNFNIRYGERLALTGPNGGGKTTLVRTLAGELPPLRGCIRLGRSVKPGYMAQEQEALDPALNAFETLQRLAPGSETQSRAFLHRFLFTGDDVFVPVGKLSYGERARLQLACLVAAGCNFLLLDEPINHLDIPSRGRFEQALEGFPGAVLAVVHDRYFISRFASQVWEIKKGALKIIRLT